MLPYMFAYISHVWPVLNLLPLEADLTVIMVGCPQKARMFGHADSGVMPR